MCFGGKEKEICRRETETFFWHMLTHKHTYVQMYRHVSTSTNWCAITCLWRVYTCENIDGVIKGTHWQHTATQCTVWNHLKHTENIDGVIKNKSIAEWHIFRASELTWMERKREGRGEREWEKETEKMRERAQVREWEPASGREGKARAREWGSEQKRERERGEKDRLKEKMLRYYSYLHECFNLKCHVDNNQDIERNCTTLQQVQKTARECNTMHTHTHTHTQTCTHTHTHSHTHTITNTHFGKLVSKDNHKKKSNKQKTLLDKRAIATYWNTLQHTATKTYSRSTRAVCLPRSRWACAIAPYVHLCLDECDL